MSRLRRHAVIREVLEEQLVPSHGSLREALQHRGIAVTQATLSRDLRDMGVVKSPEGYRLPGAIAPIQVSGTVNVSAEIPAGHHVLSVVEAAGMIVLRTTPGSAGVVALEPDRSAPACVAGTVAGDDTVFVAVAKGAGVQQAADVLRTLVGLGEPRTAGTAGNRERAS